MSSVAYPLSFAQLYSYQGVSDGIWLHTSSHHSQEDESEDYERVIIEQPPSGSTEKLKQDGISPNESKSHESGTKIPDAPVEIRGADLSHIILLGTRTVTGL